ncbi:MAG: hypothetical protein ACK4NY_23925 [Spirosomataceae bacterium]
MLARIIILLPLIILITWWFVRDTYIKEIESLKRIIVDLKNQLKSEDKIQFGEAELSENEILKQKILTLEAQLLVYKKSIGDRRPHGTMNSITKEIKKDDLKIVEGIGPKIEDLLNKAGIHTFAELAQIPAAEIKKILEAAGSRYHMHDPTTWAEQAAMARDNRWNELKHWQDELNKGRVTNA